MANQMLSCYASTGRTGRALHYFYKVVRDSVEEDGFYIPGPHPTHLSKAEVEAWMETRRQQGIGRVLTTGVEKAEGGLVDTIKEKNSIMTNDEHLGQ
jgi:pentatricopeptide repeat protein